MAYLGKTIKIVYINEDLNPEVFQNVKRGDCEFHITLSCNLYESQDNSWSIGNHNLFLSMSSTILIAAVFVIKYEIPNTEVG